MILLEMLLSTGSDILRLQLLAEEIFKTTSLVLLFLIGKLNWPFSKLTALYKAQVDVIQKHEFFCG